MIFNEFAHQINLYVINLQCHGNIIGMWMIFHEFAYQINRVVKKQCNITENVILMYVKFRLYMNLHT